MRKRQLLAIAMLVVSVATSFAARVETISVRSAAMSKDIKVVVVTPDIASDVGRTAYPVVYMLHGYGGNQDMWIDTKPDLPEIADEKGIIFVCPAGENSWYWDSPKNPNMRYETFISSELVKFIDSHYATIPQPRGRAITGLSMGGHGALWNAIRHTDVFGAAGSTSGGVDIRPFPKEWEMSKQLGDEETNKQVWEDHTVINQVGKLKNGELAIIFDCGFDDFFFPVNNALHQLLLALKIDHDYITRPGGHTGEYWNNSIDYQILFFDKFFERGEPLKQ